MFASHYESGGDIIEINGKLFKQFYGEYIIDYILVYFLFSILLYFVDSHLCRL